MLAPYTRAIAGGDAAASAGGARHELSPEEALAASVAASSADRADPAAADAPAAEPARPRKPPVRIRRGETTDGSH